jgi:hypothetical protein
LQRRQQQQQQLVRARELLPVEKKNQWHLMRQLAAAGDAARSHAIIPSELIYCF